jgi:hypothetical protein
MIRLLAHARSNAVAYLALFVALGGTSYAAVNLPAGSVGNRQLRNHSVSAIKLERSSIGGYVREWATIDGQGQLVASRPRARLLRWSETGMPGGIVSWGHPFPYSCFVLTTTDTAPTPVSYASASNSSAGDKTGRPEGAAVFLSTPHTGVHVAVVCPQP